MSHVIAQPLNTPLLLNKVFSSFLMKNNALINILVNKHLSIVNYLLRKSS